METIFLILSGVILFAGVMYWMWSHLQLTQKKVQLLENAVFELRAMIPGGGTAGPPPTVAAPAVVAHAATKTFNDLADDDWEVQAAVEPVPEKSTPLEAVGPANTPANTPELVTREIGEDVDIPDGATLNDLMPGGRADGVPAVEEATEVQEVELTEKKFKELFASRLVPDVAPATTAPTAASLEGMPLKELRRLGEQRGIRGASEMRKKELLAALRSQVTVPAAAAAEEKTLDLEAVEAVEAAATAEEVVEPVAEEAEILE